MPFASFTSLNTKYLSSNSCELSLGSLLHVARLCRLNSELQSEPRTTICSGLRIPSKLPSSDSTLNIGGKKKLHIYISTSSDAAPGVKYNFWAQSWIAGGKPTAEAGETCGVFPYTFCSMRYALVVMTTSCSTKTFFVVDGSAVPLRLFSLSTDL